MDIKYPNVTVKLTGTDGNAFAIIGKVQRVIESKIDHKASGEFADAAFACKSYNDLLALVMRTVNVS